MTQQIKARGGRKARTFYDRRLRKSGNTRTIAVGKVLPHTWDFVRIRTLKEGDGYAIIKFSRLSVVETNASVGKADKTSKQNPQKTRTTSSN